MSLPVRASSRSTSSLIVVWTPIPTLRKTSVASDLSERMFARATSSTCTKSYAWRAVAEDQRRLAGFDLVEHLHDHADVGALVVHPRAVDVHVAKADVVEPVLLVDRAEELLAGDLGRAVERPVVERVVLGHRESRARRRRPRPTTSTRPCSTFGALGRLDHVVGADDVDVDRVARVVHALVQPQGGEVERVVALLHHLVEERQIDDRALDESRRAGRAPRPPGCRASRARSCRRRSRARPARRAVDRRCASR